MPLRMDGTSPHNATDPSPPPAKKEEKTQSYPSNLPPEAIDLATRLFNAARTGDLPIFQQAIPAGLPINLTNDKGDTLVLHPTPHTLSFLRHHASAAKTRCDY